MFIQEKQIKKDRCILESNVAVVDADNDGAVEVDEDEDEDDEDEDDEFAPNVVENRLAFCTECVGELRLNGLVAPLIGCGGGDNGGDMGTINGD